MNNKLLFNDWSTNRINEGKKYATCRIKRYNDKRIFAICKMPLWIVKNYLWRIEGANSPKEFKKVWISIYGKFNPNQNVYVHFGIFNKRSN